MGLASKFISTIARLEASHRRQFRLRSFFVWSVVAIAENGLSPHHGRSSRAASHFMALAWVLVWNVCVPSNSDIRRKRLLSKRRLVPSSHPFCNSIIACVTGVESWTSLGSKLRVLLRPSFQATCATCVLQEGEVEMQSGLLATPCDVCMRERRDVVLEDGFGVTTHHPILYTS